MIILDATTKSVQVLLGAAATTTELPVTANFVDITTTTYVPTASDGITTGTTAMTLVAAPAASTQRQVKFFSIYNADTVPSTVTVRLNNNATLRILHKVTLNVGSSLLYTDGEGFRVVDSNGVVLAGVTRRLSYSVFYTPATVALNLEVGELFNAHATAVTRVRGIWIMPTNTSLATAVQVGFDTNRISVVGNGASTETPRPYDTLAPGVPAGITARRGSTTGATLVYKYWTQYLWNDELSPGNPFVAMVNQLPVYGDQVEEIVLRPSQGVQLKISQVTGTAVGLVGAKIDFVVDL